MTLYKVVVNGRVFKRTYSKIEAEKICHGVALALFMADMSNWREVVRLEERRK